jgi:hypothetical protein
MANIVPSPEVLRQLLTYEPETGRLVWRRRDPQWFASEGSWKSWNSRYAGKPALAARIPGGHRMGVVLGVRVASHRVAWAIHTGQWPTAEIDHVNGVPDDNRFVNLREATRSENMRNVSSKGGTSKYVGVHWCRTWRRWVASVSTPAGQRNVGKFSSEVDAARARDAAALKYYGEFARLNFPLERRAA